MAVAMSGGLFVSTILTLLALPVIYASWYRVDKKTKAALDSKVEETINEKEIDNSINELDNKPG